MTRSVFLAPLALAALFVWAGDASAHLEPGEAAPALAATAFVNTPPVSLRGLRGRVVLLEFFSTACKHCKRHVPQLNVWHARYAARGLTVLGVTRDGVDKTRAFVRAQRARYPIAIAGLDAQRAYLVQRYPEACLVSAFGDVLWSGPATKLPESEIRNALARARPQPAYPLTQRWIAAGLAQGHYAGTRRRLARLLHCRPGVDEGCSAALAAHAWIAWYGRERLAQAPELRVLGRPYAAWRALDEIRRFFGADREAEAARKALTRLLSSDTVKAEVAAGRDLTATIARAGALPSAQAALLYEQVAVRHRGTTAAQRAERKARLLRKKKR